MVLFIYVNRYIYKSSHSVTSAYVIVKHECLLSRISVGIPGCWLEFQETKSNYGRKVKSMKKIVTSASALTMSSMQGFHEIPIWFKTSERHES